ncbi:DNRLRE domain-containing protein [Peribacillus simplex]|uniref:DNRLRE domain-containing protein n=1 Tax=Peribacillus simplex TaxID=1478 RepID=UPI003D2D971D
MIRFRKCISFLLVLALICSLLPNYAGATSNDQTENNKQTEEVNTENLKEIVKERTADSKTYSNGDGNFVKEIYPEEIHNKIGKNYQDISEDLVKKNKTGYLETEATNLQAEFPEELGKNTPIVYSSGEHNLSFKLAFATDGENKSNPSDSSVTEQRENAVTYKSIYNDIDLRHIALNKEVKEDWIMNKYNGINEFHYDIETDLFGEIEKDGSIGFYETDSKEEKVFVLPKPAMVDSNYNETLGDGVRSSDIKYELNKKSDGGYDLALKANKEWLASSKRVFPIYIDPSVSIDALGDTFVSSAYPKNNLNKEWDPVQGEYVLKTGYYDSTTGTNYAFVKFSVVGDLKGAVIDSADLQAYVTHAYYVSQKNGLWVDEVNGQWYADELTWNNKPSSTKITSTSVGRDEWAHFNVANTIQAWVSGERSNYGFKFHTNGNGQTHWKKITAAESAKKVKLAISYHYEKMKNPTVSSYSYGEGKADGYIDVKWESVHGAKSYDLQMYDGKGYQTIYSGTGTNWSSKGKKIFPKSPYTTSSTYRTDGTGIELPVNPSEFYSKKSGAATTKKDYGFRVVAKFANGDSPVSTAVFKTIPVIQVGSPERPTVKGNVYPESDSTNKGRGWLDISWKPVANATGYKVLIWNGNKFEEFPVGKSVTSVSTKGKKIWPTDAEIAAGKNSLHITDLSSTGSPSVGAELPNNPGLTYNNGSKRYSIRVKAVTALGDTPYSDDNFGYIPLYAPKNVKITGNDDNLVQNKTSFTLKWDESSGAKYYDVILNDGKTDEVIRVKGETSYTTKSKYNNDQTYSATVQAYYEDDDTVSETEYGKLTGKRGLSPKATSQKITPKTYQELIGLEDYFTYEDQNFGNAAASVNVTTGNMVLQFTDESLDTRSDLGYDFTRTYNSRSTKNSALGKGWTFIGNESLRILENGDGSYTDEDSTVHLFKKDGNQFTSPKGLYEKLVKVNDTTYTMTDKNQFVQTFKVGQKSPDFFIESYQDEYGNQIDFTRNDKDQLTSVSETKGIEKKEKIQISYTDNKISKVQYADHWTTFKYTGDQLTQTTIGSDKAERKIVENFTYNTQGQLAKYVDGKNNETVFTYKENEITLFDKKEKDEELSVTNTYQYNTKDNEFKVINSSDTETVYKRDEKNNTYAVSQVIEPSEGETNSTTIFDLDNQYNIVKVTNPDGTTEENTYDKNGNLLTSKSTDGTTTNTYNSRNQVTETVATNGEITTNSYKGPSLISSTVKDETTKFEYDSFGRVIKTLYPNGTYEAVAYDDNNHKVTNTDKKGNTTSVTYTIYGQKQEETDAGSHTKTFTYDSLYKDSLTSIVDGNGHKTTYKYDDNNNLSTITDALGREKSYLYNDNDQVTKVEIPKMTFQYGYDINGEKNKSILPSGINTIYNYNESGQVDTVQVKNPMGDIISTTSYQYDENGKTSKVSHDGKDLKTYGYTSETNLLAKYTLGLFTQSYSYDDQERETKRQSAYDKGLSVTKETLFKDKSDDIGHVKYSVDDKTLHNYQYDTKTEENQSILNLNDGVLKQVAQFNDANLLSSLTYTSKTKQPFDIQYDYTKNGNISKEAVDGNVSRFEYDKSEQLTKETLPNGDVNTYEYDGVGNRTKAKLKGKEYTFSYNDANQITKKNATAYKYDANGNLLEDENYKYAYNERQQLTSVKTFAGKDIVAYTYDEDGLRLTKTIGTTRHEYFYNDDVLDMEIVKENNQITQYRSYEWNEYIPLGMIVKEKDAMGTFQTNAYQFITNQRGDVLSIRNADDKEVGSYEYDAYGNVLAVEGNIAKDNPVRYAGYYYDEETKNYYLQARYYNPENGSFLAIDPLPGKDYSPISQNGYTYAENNPIMLIDSDGHAAVGTYKTVTYKASASTLRKKMKAGKVTYAIVDHINIFLSGGIGTRAKTFLKGGVYGVSSYAIMNTAGLGAKKQKEETLKFLKKIKAKGAKGIIIKQKFRYSYMNGAGTGWYPAGKASVDLYY